MSSGYEKSAKFYDLFTAQDDIAYLVGLITHADTALDIGAGTGRLAIPLALSGMEVYCIEQSPAMIDVFVANVAQYPEAEEKISLVRDNAATFDLRRQFDLALLVDIFDHFLTEQVRFEVFQNIHRHLKRDGVLVFNTGIGWVMDSPLSPAGEAKMGDFIVRREIGRKVLDENTMEVLLAFEKLYGDKSIIKVEETMLVGIMDRPGIMKLLNEIGFRVVRELGNYEGKPYEDGDEQLIIEAVK